MKKIFRSIVVWISLFQLLFLQITVTYAEGTHDQTSSMSLEQEMEKFFHDLVGKGPGPIPEEITPDLQFSKYIQNDTFMLPYAVFYDKIKQKKEENTSLMGQMSKRILEHREEEATKNIFDPNLIAIIKKNLRIALSFKEKIEKLDDPKIFIKYIDQIVLPMRKIYIVGQFFDHPQKSTLLIEELDDLLSLEHRSQLKEELLSKGIEEDGRAYKFHPIFILKNDAHALLQAPSEQNYIKAIKSAIISKIVTQSYFYSIMGQNPDQLKKNKVEISIPTSCNLSTSVDTSKFESLLHPGKTLTAIQYHLFHSFLNNDISLRDNYFLNAKLASERPSDQELQISRRFLDDSKNYAPVLYIKEEEIKKIFTPLILHTNYTKGAGHGLPARPGNKKNNIQRQYRIYELFSKVIAVDKRNDENSYIDTLKKEYQNDDLLNILEILNIQLVDKMKDNLLNRQFSAFYDTENFNRDLSLLVKTLKNSKDSHRLKSIIDKSCSPIIVPHSSKRNPIIQDSSLASSLMTIQSLCSQHGSQVEKILDFLNSKENKKEIYTLLKNIWNNLIEDKETSSFQDFKDLTQLSEYVLLKYLLGEESPWAFARISYLIAYEQLTQLSNTPKYFGTDLLRFKRAGKVLMLDRPLLQYHLQTHLSDDEKVFLWEYSFSSYDESTLSLFKSSPTKRDNKKITLSTILYDVFNSNLSKKKERQKLKNKWPSSIDAYSFQYQYDEDFIMYSHDNGSEDVAYYRQKDADLQDLIQRPTLPKLNTYLEKYDEQFPDLNFIETRMNNDKKMAVTLQLLRASALERKRLSYETLDRLCQLNPQDDQAYNAIVATIKNSDRQTLHSEAGIDELPKNIDDKISSLLDHDWRMIQVTGTQLLFTGLVAGAGLACTYWVVTIPWCLTMIPTIKALGSVTLLGTQASLVAMEYSQKKRADSLENIIEDFHDVGISDENASDSVSLSWLHTGFEVLGTVLWFRVFKSMLIEGIDGFYRIHKFKQLNRNSRHSTLFAHEKNISLYDQSFITKLKEARLILGFQDKKTNFLITKTKNFITHFQGKFQKGLISKQQFDRELAKYIKVIRTTVKGETELFLHPNFIPKALSNTEINQRTILQINDLFHGDLKQFKKFLEYYKEKAVKIAKKIQGKEKLNFFENWRYKNLIQNEKNIIELFEKIKNISNVTATPGALVPIDQRINLGEFLGENIDMISKIMIDMPLKKREYPYLIFALGGPVLSKKSLSGLAHLFRPLHLFPDLSLLQRLLIARNDLLVENLQIIARKTLKMPQLHEPTPFYHLFSAFLKESTKFVTTPSNFKHIDIQKKNLALLDDALDKINLKIFKNDASKVIVNHFFEEELTLPFMKKLLFNPETIKEKSISRLIWEQLPSHFFGTVDHLNFSSLTHLFDQIPDSFSINGKNDYLKVLAAAAQILSTRLPKRSQNVF